MLIGCLLRSAERVAKYSSPLAKNTALQTVSRIIVTYCHVCRRYIKPDSTCWSSWPSRWQFMQFHYRCPVAHNRHSRSIKHTRISRTITTGIFVAIVILRSLWPFCPNSRIPTQVPISAREANGPKPLATCALSLGPWAFILPYPPLFSQILPAFPPPQNRISISRGVRHPKKLDTLFRGITKEVW
jgi:hypothetical protein